MKNLLLIAFVVLGIANAQAQDVEFNKWKIYETKDEFGDPSGDKALIYYSDSDNNATFSNSATSNSDLMAGFRVEAVDSVEVVIGIALFEYETSRVKAHSDTKYEVRIKDDGGKIHSTTLKMREGGNFIIDDDTIFELLKINKILKIHMKEVTDGYPSTYKFEVNTDNFNELLPSL